MEMRGFQRLSSELKNDATMMHVLIIVDVAPWVRQKCMRTVFRSLIHQSTPHREGGLDGSHGWLVPDPM